MGAQTRKVDNLDTTIEKIRSANINLLTELIITDPIKLMDLIERLQSQLLKASGDKKKVIEKRIEKLDSILEKQIDLTAFMVNASIDDQLVIQPEFEFRQPREIIKPSDTQEIKEQIESGKLIDATKVFIAAADGQVTVKPKEEIILTKKDELAAKMAKESAEKDPQLFLGYERKILVNTTDFFAMDKLFQAKVKSADTESKVDEVCKTLIDEGFYEKGLNLALDLFTTPLGNTKLPKKKRAEVEARYVSETLPWARKTPVVAMKDINERNLEEWCDYINDIHDVYSNKGKIIINAISDIQKQKFIAKEAGDPIKGLMLEPIIYDEILNEISLGCKCKPEEIVFEKETESIEDKNANIQDAEIIDESALQEKEEIVTKAEEQALETEAGKPTPEVVKAGLTEIIMKSISDTSINVVNACGSFFKQIGGRKIMKNFDLTKWISEKRKELTPVIDQAKIEEERANVKEVEKLEDKAPETINTVVPVPAKKLNLFKPIAIEEIEKIDSSIVEHISKIEYLTDMTSFLQQVIFDIPRKENPTIPDKGKAYQIAASLAQNYIKKLKGQPCAEWTPEEIAAYFREQVVKDGLAARPHIAEEKLKEKKIKKEEEVDKTVKVLFDNTNKKVTEKLHEAKETAHEKAGEVPTSLSTTEPVISKDVTTPIQAEATQKPILASTDNVVDLIKPDPDILLKFSDIMSTKNKKDFQTRSEEFLAQKEYKDLETRKNELAHSIWKQSALRKGARPEERMNGVMKIVNNSDRIKTLVM